MSAILKIPVDELATAPRIWTRAANGMSARVVDPGWIADWRRRDAARAASDPRAGVLDLQSRIGVLAEGETERRWRRWFSAAHREIAVDFGLDDIEPRITAREVMAAVAAYHGVSLTAIRSDRREKEVVIARQHAAYELKRTTSLSLPQIGKVMGGRDHTTIIHAVKVWPGKAKALGIPCEEI